MTAAAAYRRTQNETASKERLMVLLFETALRHIRASATAFDEKRFAEALASCGRASDIVSELLATLRRDQAPELCDQLADLYAFVLSRLLRATTARSSAPLKEAERVFEPIALGFAEAVRQLESQGAPVGR